MMLLTIVTTPGERHLKATPLQLKICTLTNLSLLMSQQTPVTALPLSVCRGSKKVSTFLCLTELVSGNIRPSRATFVKEEIALSSCVPGLRVCFQSPGCFHEFPPHVLTALQASVSNILGELTLRGR